jgi:hypothetical protein
MSRPLVLILVSGLILVGMAIVFVLRQRDESPIIPETPKPQPQNPIEAWFEERAQASGVSHVCRNGEEADRFTILESLGGGVAFLDYDGDGRMDLLAAGGGTFDQARPVGTPCKLFRNRGDNTFEDATAAAGLERAWHYNHGFAVGDFDRDGWPDFVVTGYGRLLLFHNIPGANGSRRFEEVSERLGLADGSWSTSAAWGDINGDGWPDLYVCHYVDWSPANDPHCTGLRIGIPREVCPPVRFKPLLHALFMNEAGQRFRDAGVDQGFKPAGCGLGVAIADVNDDAKPDIYVANDATDNFLFVNRGQGKLVEVASRAGVSGDDTGRFNGSMGVDVADFDGTGRAAIWVTNFQGELHALYRNLARPAPNEAFDHHSRAAGIATLGSHWVGFGTALADFDGDGWEDIAIANGHVLRNPTLGSPFKQKPLLLRNVDREGRRVFKDASANGGQYFQKTELGRGLAIGDWNNDGRPDLAISNTNTPLALLRNIAPESVWLGVSLSGRDHRDIVGSTVILETSTRTLTRFVKGGGSYLSAHDPRILFRFPSSETIKKLTVKWSWGAVQSWERLEPGAYWNLREDQAAASRAK